jgi:hypothetical protein
VESGQSKGVLGVQHFGLGRCMERDCWYPSTHGGCQRGLCIALRRSACPFIIIFHCLELQKREDLPINPPLPSATPSYFGEGQIV